MIRRFYLFLTELLYHQFAWAYDGVAALVSAGYWKHWGFAILPDLTGHRILELGHGPGHLQAALLEKGDRVIGLDKSPEMTRQAAHRLRKKQPRLVHGAAGRLPFADQSFDRVAATFPTNYITARDTLAEIYRVLAPGGRVVVVPGARLVAPRGAAQQLAAGIFQMFGLSQDWELVARQAFVVPMQCAGFNVLVERRPFRSSEIFVIIGEKYSEASVTD
ncbi:MAG: methyltransferase domain-containing protein [Anaerolineales bacterium]|nr:methyltransferase domain-containing protein [Anaerolineales bacterium]